MNRILFDITTAKDGHCFAKARDLDIATNGSSFEEMQPKAIALARAHFASAIPQPKTISVAFEEVLDMR